MGSKLYLPATIIDIKTAFVLSSAQVPFTHIDDIYDLLPVFCAELAKSFDDSLKIGDRGPGGGLVFYIDGNKYLESSDNLGKATWYEAIEMGKNYRGGEYDDWYLPTTDELNYIYENLRVPGHIKSNGWFWSSSEQSNDTAFKLWFLDGGPSSIGGDLKTNDIDVRIVRAFY